MLRDSVQWLTERAKGRTVFFLSGAVVNNDEIHDLFAQIFVLSIDKETLEHRLGSRGTVNNFGKSESERNYILSCYELLEKDALELGAVTIDAAHPVSAVVDRILDSVASSTLQNEIPKGGL